MIYYWGLGSSDLSCIGEPPAEPVRSGYRHLVAQNEVIPNPKSPFALECYGWLSKRSPIVWYMFERCKGLKLPVDYTSDYEQIWTHKKQKRKFFVRYRPRT